MEQFAKQNSKNPEATYYPKGELIIVKDSINNFQLAWKFIISTMEPDDELLVIINAITGQLINKGTLILDNNVACVAQTLYSGNQNITGDTYAGGIRLSEVRNNVNIHTLNMQNQVNNYNNAAEFSNNNTNWTTGNWANINQDQAALDAHWAGEMVFDYWHNVQNRNSIDGNGIPIIGYVHFYVPNSSAGWPDNAAWVPGNNNHFMEYGDGDGATYRPFVALDIAAHEIGHGINEFTSDLGTVNQNQEEDALNEGLSDIWGISVKNFAASTKPLWLLGGEILIGSTYNCIRNAQDPKSTLAAEGQHPNTYHGQYWSNGGEPHTNSTVLSHWFYLLVQGGSGTNDNSDAYNVSGIGINEAQQIVYQAEAHHLQPGDDYADARNAMIDAATELYCANSPEVAAVTNAWYAVGVGAAYSGNTMSISGISPICTSSTFSVINQPTGVSSITWSTDYSYIATINSSGVATKVSNGTATIYAIVNGTGSCSTQLNDPVQVGLKTPSFVVNALDYCQGSHFTAIATSNNPGQPISSYNWFLDGSPQSYTGFKLTGTFPSDNNYMELSVSSTNCGTSDIYYVPDLNCSGGFDFIIAPNPASNTVTITTANTGTTDTTTNTASRNSVVSKTTTPAAKAIIKQVKIVDVGGRLMKQMDYSTAQQQVTFDVTALKPGIYFVSISDGKSISYKKLLIQR